MGILLSVEEWKLVEKQCEDCTFWSDEEGCNHPKASDPRPARECRVKESENP